jgi:arginase family enzyme
MSEKMQEKLLKKRNKILSGSIMLNFDDSFNNVGIDRIDFRGEEENIRYYCSHKRINELSSIIWEKVSGRKVVFTGSGDFHHITYAILKTVTLPLVQLVVFDNHPDNMIFPFGIHCGSWVYHASKLPNVSRISVIGIGSGDIGGPNLFQNHYGVLRSGKVRYCCLRDVPRLAGLFSGGGIKDIRAHRGKIAEFLRDHVLTDDPVYLSIDKDVLSPEAAPSSWDQGSMSEDDLLDCVRMMSPRIVKADVCGDLSSYTFKTPGKKILRIIDGGEKRIDDIERQREIHARLNLKILDCIG